MRTNGEFIDRLRIIWTIASKDIVEAIRNKTILLIMGSVALFMVLAQLPALLKQDDTHGVVIYDAGGSGLAAAVADSQQADVLVVSSQEEMLEVVGDVGGSVLGLVVPDVQTVSEDQPLDLDGYFVHSAPQSKRAETVRYFEQLLGQLTGRQVQITVVSGLVYPSPDAVGQPFLIALLLVVSIITTSTSIVPYLVVEEKETGTLDALLVFPVSMGQIVIGKALAGMVYGIAVAIVLFAFNTALVVHWGVAITGILTGTLFAVSLGLLMGTLFENRQTMILWGTTFMMILIVPVFISNSSGLGWPEFIRTALPWTPAVTLSRIFRVAFSGSAQLADFLPETGVVMGSALLALGIMAWLLRRRTQ
nr:ABC transporter permease [Anaerolineae bacterium]